MSYTENLSDFGARERGMLMDILKTWDKSGLPSNFDDEKVRPAMNMNSGFVFLVNEDFKCCMLNVDTGHLEVYHNTPHDGHEGYLVNLLEEHTTPDELNSDDEEYLRDMAEAEGVDLPDFWKDEEEED